tara:strand:- start:25 stop:354 length:330 start_codon:yes stop_codon:yes gene_type:complete
MNKNENNNDEFELLRKIGLNPNSSQRHLADELGFSLGKLNYCLKALKKKGLIKIKNFKNNPDKSYYAYLLTPKGITHKSKMAFYFMKQKAKEYEELKKEVYKNNNNYET